MRIFFITSKLNFETAGGSVVDIHLRAKGLLENGNNVTVITAFSSANKISSNLSYGVIEENIGGRMNLINIQRGIYRILKKYEKQADVFYIDGHMFLYGGGFYRLIGGSVPIAAAFNIRLNCWADTQNNNGRQPIFKKIKRKLRILVERCLGVPLANHLDVFIFNTPMLEKLYLDFGFDRKKSYVIEDFVDTADIIRREKMTPEKIAFNQQKDIITIFCSGRMIPEKGFDLVIKAFSLIKNKEKCRVIMSGGGPDENRLRDLVRDLKLQKFFYFPGWVSREELLGFFREAQIFVFPKWWIEYGSVVLTEAMAFGLPCIVPEGGALVWLAKSGALTFKEDDAVSLAQRIEDLGNSRELRIKLAKNSFIRASDLNYKNSTTVLDRITRSIAVS